MNEEVLQNIYNQLVSNKLTSSDYNTWKQNFSRSGEVQKNVHQYLSENNLTKSDLSQWKANLGVKKKEVSEPIATKEPVASSTPTTKPATSLATEEPEQVQASDGLGGPAKNPFGQEQKPVELGGFAVNQQPLQVDISKKSLKEQADYYTKEFRSAADRHDAVAMDAASKKQFHVQEKIKSIQEAKNKIFSVDQAKIDQDIADEETKNQGFFGGLKQGATNVLNAVATGMNRMGLIDETGDLKLSEPFHDQLKKIDKNLPQDKRLAMAKDMFAKEKAKQQIDLNAESILSSTDPYIQQALKTEAIKNLKANTKDKAIAVQIQAITHDLDELKKNPTPENLQKINELQNQYKSLTNDYKKNRYKLSPEDQAKLFSLNYSAYDKLTGDLTAGLERGVAGAFNLAGQVTNKGLDIAGGAGLLPKGFTKENINKLKEVNPYSKIGEKITEGAEALSSEYRQVSLSDIANSDHPVNELGRWAGQTINGIISFALPFLFGEGEAQLGAKLYIAASGAGNKAYEVDRENKQFKLAAADAYAKGYEKFEFDGKEYNTKKEKGKDLYSELEKFSVSAGYGAVDFYMAGGRLNSLKGGAKAMETALGDNIAKEQFENGLKGALLEAKGVAGSIAKKAHHGGALFAKVEAAKMFLDDKILDKKVDNPIERLAEAYGDGVAMDLFAQGSPMLFGYVVGKVSPNQNVVEIKNNTKKIIDYEKTLEDANDTDKEIINASIKELNDKNYGLVMKAYDQTKGMTPKQIQTLLDIEKQKINIKKDAEYIKSDESELDPSDKKEILKGLKGKFAELENKKIDVFNNEFSALNVLDQKEQDRLKSQAKSELGEGAKEDLINKRATEIHRVELAKQAKENITIKEKTPEIEIIKPVDIESQKADIEKRRQEELEPINLARAKGDQTGEIPVVDGEMVSKKTIKDINAKYDAELAALEKSPKDIAREEWANAKQYEFTDVETGINYKINLAEHADGSRTIELLNENLPNKFGGQIIKISKDFKGGNEEAIRGLVGQSDGAEIIALEGKPSGEKVVPLHEALEGVKDIKYKKNKIEFVNKNIDKIIKELGLETINCD